MKLLGLELLKNKKNLLAFSHGTDSTALFHQLVLHDVAFDVALLNYKTRATSDEEAASAGELCKRFGKKFFCKEVCGLGAANFEKRARDERYAFFREICLREGYVNLVTAHNLNDNFEWLLMQLSRGSANLCGMRVASERDGFCVVRPLLQTSKREILLFLEELAKRGERFFLDETNLQNIHFRNEIRAEFATPFLAKFENGVKKSLFLLEKNSKFDEKFEFECGVFFVCKGLSKVDKACKRLGVVMSEKTREEVKKGDCVVGHKVAVVRFLAFGQERGQECGEFFLVAPFEKVEAKKTAETAEKTAMSKKTKERFRVAKIPPLVRPFLSKNEEIFEAFLAWVKANR